jgi:hypothetical protein
MYSKKISYETRLQSSHDTTIPTCDVATPNLDRRRQHCCQIFTGTKMLKCANVDRKTLVVEECLQMKYTSGNVPSQDTIVGQRYFKAARAQYWCKGSLNCGQTVAELTKSLFYTERPSHQKINFPVPMRILLKQFCHVTLLFTTSKSQPSRTVTIM